MDRPSLSTRAHCRHCRTRTVQLAGQCTACGTDLLAASLRAEARECSWHPGTPAHWMQGELAACPNCRDRLQTHVHRFLQRAESKASDFERDRFSKDHKLLNHLAAKTAAKWGW